MPRTHVGSAVISVCIALAGAVALTVFHSHSHASANILATAASVDAHQARPILQMYEQSPLTFEENRGQTDSRVRFLSRGRGYSLFLTDDAAVLSLRSRQGQAATVRLRPAQPSAAMSIEPERRSATVSNYLIGNDPKAWRRGVAQYERVRYRNVYPGVDLVYYGNQRQLEHDFMLAPGADPRHIRVKIEGAERLATNQHGDLVLHTAAGKAMLKRPDIYQERDGAREPVSGSYRIIAPDTVSFEVGRYDSARALVIDPVLSYSTLLGGGNVDTAEAIALDHDKNAYITGNTTSDNFPVTSNAYDKTCAGGTCNTGSGRVGDAFVAKISLTGTRVYVTYLGGNDFDNGSGIAVDSSGNAYVSGATASTDFPGTTIGTLDSNALHAFVTKVAPDGSSLIYSVRFGNSSREVGEPARITLDSAGNATVSGVTTTTNFPTTAGVAQPASAGGNDAFVARLNAAGTAFLWATYLGGSGDDRGADLALDGDGNVYVLGFTTSSNFPTTAGSFQPTYHSANGTDFVTKLKNDGSALVYATYLGGTTAEFASGIAVDPFSGNAYVAGGTESSDFPTTPGTFSSTFNCPPGCGQEGFVSQLNSTGSALVYSTFVPHMIPAAIAVDFWDNAYVGGSVNTSSVGMITTMTAFQRVPGGSLEGAIMKLRATGPGIGGGNLIYSSFIGGKGNDLVTGVALDANGNAFLSGFTDSVHFPVTPGAFQTTNAHGDTDAFIARAVSLCILGKTNPSVTVCQPSDGATVTSPVTIVAGTFDNNARVKSMQVLVDGTAVYSANLSAVEIRWKMTAGPHTITATATDTSGATFQKSVAITVGP